MRGSIGCAGPIGGQKAGASVPFVDPALSALDADVFWHPAAYGRVLSAYLDRHDRPGINSPFSLHTLSCRKSILLLANGEQHLLLRDAQRAIQLHCLGGSIICDPSAIGLLADEFPSVERKIRLLRRFAGLYRATRPGRSLGEWSAPALRLRNALIALDGVEAHATYREIAEVIYGPAFVAERWGRGQRNLKDQMVRAVRRGRYLANGGYVGLLR